ncbi:MAG: hypothetical protein UR93_C0037G0002 [Berkelbacteria bacterium GW2011_GWA2_35_9]|uniref:Uncharacterized protein n=1 Tax=Berkelbacteria bacterium GW2011_GWA2_35_9 TaxID=1618333 RepID=A0A0G0D069_9BACT|nr:MAG: hypothetical protein UR93_C0037G0002 [Berkelbacteria bacterium GW2011_GWA2_35_9]
MSETQPTTPLDSSDIIHMGIGLPPQSGEHIPERNEATENAFFARERSLIDDFSQGLGVAFKPGDGWAVNPDTGEATYDPKFFTEKGYSETQSIFATLHEIDHVKEFTQLRTTEEGKQILLRRREAAKKERRKHVLENCLLDVADNHRVVGQFPTLSEDVAKLYKEKLWPSTDFTDKPKHLQLAYAILRTGMLPDEAVQVDPKVQEAMDGLRHVRGRSGSERNIIEIVTNPSLDPLTKVKLVEKYVEPVYEKLFEEDKNDKDKQRNEQGQQQGPQNPEDDFSSDYDDYAENSPEAMSPEEVEQAVEASAPGEDKNDISGRQNAGYEKEHGVNKKDMAEYRTEYQKIEQYIEPMREQFRKIVAERLEPYRKLVGFFDEGVMIEPGLAGQALTDLSKGISDPTIFRDYEGRVRREEVPSVFEATAVLDRSGSMDSGGRKEEQRRAAILLMESLREFLEMPEVRDNLLAPELRTLSEIRSFGGRAENVVVKPLSPDLDEKQRVEIFKHKEIGNRFFRWR